MRGSSGCARRWRCTRRCEPCGASVSTSSGRRCSLEYVALANHRKAIRDEIARTAERFRELQLDAITAILRARGIAPEVCPPVVLLLAMSGVTQAIAIEEALGITSGHDEMVRFVEAWIDEAERDLVAASGFGGRSGRASGV